MSDSVLSVTSYLLLSRSSNNIFQTTIACVGGESARSFTEYYVDILFALNKKYFDNLRHWLTEMVNTDNFPSANITKEQKQQFATFVLRERTNKRKLLEVTREFSLACCGLVSLLLQRIQPSYCGPPQLERDHCSLLFFFCFSNLLTLASNRSNENKQKH